MTFAARQDAGAPADQTGRCRTTRRSWAKGMTSGGHRGQDQQGIALLTVLMLMVILTVIGIGALTVTGLGTKIAGFGRTGEAAASATESCLGTGVKIIQQTIEEAAVPALFLDSASPAGPIPNGNATVLQQEIMGQSDNNPDAADSAPNMVLTINNYTVRGDIDRLYRTPKAGNAMQMFNAYEGSGSGTGAGGIDILYRIDCTVTDQATSANSRISAVYACSANGDTCQRKL